MQRSTEVFSYGANEKPPVLVQLKAGRIDAVYEEGALRYINVDGVEILRGIYSAVRDHNWNTVPGEIIEETIEKTDDSFKIDYRVSYKDGPVEFLAAYKIEGENEGRITFSMHGKALSSFKKNRIGFNVLHPLNECVNQPCEVQHTDGGVEEDRFPREISPHQPFKDMKSITWRPGKSITARVDFEGDVFEMEDQRNWTDASFKTYSTPLDLPAPVEVRQGDTIEQTITLEVDAKELNGHGETKETITCSFTEAEPLPLPRFGTCHASVSDTLSTSESALLRQLQLSHYRVDLDLSADYAPLLQQAAANAKAIGARLELALHFSAEINAELTRLAELVTDSRPNVSSILIFSKESAATPQAVLNATIKPLRGLFPESLIGAGSNRYFTQLNRERVSPEKLDLLTFAITPQAHVTDSLSVTETLPAQRHVVESAKEFADGRKIFVSPVTLKKRFFRTDNAEDAGQHELPPQVDARQMSLFGACWTLGSIKYLAEAGADSVTWYESKGWRGIIQGDEPPALQGKFPAEAGEVFPMWWVFKKVAECRDGGLLPFRSSKPLKVNGLVLKREGGVRLMLANFSRDAQDVTIDQLPETISWTQLNFANVEAFMKDPVAIPGGKYDFRDGSTLKLAPYSVHCIDF